VALTIRPLEPRDTDAIAKLEMQIRTHHAKLDPEMFQNAPLDMEAILAAWVRRNVSVWVAEREGEILGYITAEPRNVGDPTSGHKPDKTWFLQTLVVEESARNQGIGAALLAHAEQEGKKAGLDSLGITYAVANPDAGRLYEREGFRPVKINMRKSLK
jgi:ribosomal protein S18 acetylase RimI-like enzyme